MKNLIKGFEFGAVTGFGMSHLGLAVVSEDGRQVSYDKTKKEIVDVEMFNIDAKGMIYKMPVAIKDIKVGDVVMHQGQPMFVESTEAGVKVIDITAGEKKEIMPIKSMFGFDFATKIVSLMDGMMGEASVDAPFGNLLPLMLLGGDKGGKNDMFQTMMMMQMMGGKDVTFDMSNPLMMMALLGGGSDDNSNFPLMMMMMNQKPTA